VNGGVSGLVLAQHLWRRAIALQSLPSVDTLRVLILRLLTAGGLGAVWKVAAQTPSPSSPAHVCQPSRSGQSLSGCFSSRPAFGIVIE